MLRDTRDLRNKNRMQIYELLLDADTTSRTEIRNATSISSPTVLRIIDEFNDLKIIEEMPLRSTAPGRPSVGFRLVADYVYSIAVFHEGTWILGCVMDVKGKIVYTKRIKAEISFDSVLNDQIPNLIETMLQQSNLDHKRIQGIALGFPAILDPYAPLIGINEPIDISSWMLKLGEKYQTFVCIENDVNSLAIGEHAKRGIEDSADMAYVALGTGIGAGIILRGKLRHGKNNRAGEIGLTLTNNGKTLEEVIGTRALFEKFPEGYSDQAEAVDFISTVLSPYLINFAICFDMDLIVLGGYTMEMMGEKLLSAVQEKIEKISAIPVKVEAGLSAQPGLDGLGRLIRLRFLQQLRNDGLQAIKQYL